MDILIYKDGRYNSFKSLFTLKFNHILFFTKNDFTPFCVELKVNRVHHLK